MIIRATSLVVGGGLALTSDDGLISVMLRPGGRHEVSDKMRHSRSIREALNLGFITVSEDPLDSSDFVAQVELNQVWGYVSGISGASCCSGVSGAFSGASGLSGFSGAGGGSGASGLSGFSGFSGAGHGTHADTVDPTQNDDNTAGFEVGDHWVNTSTDEIFVLVDDSTGNAVWVSVSSGSGSGTSGFSGFSGAGRPTHVDTVDPTQNDDNTAGFEIGDHWVNTVTDEVFILVDDSTGNAVWVSVSTGGSSGTSGFSGGIGISGVSGFSGSGRPTHVDTVDPTQNDDNTSGFEIGDHWVNTVTDEVFILVDDSSGNAVWVSVSTGGGSGTSGFSGVTGIQGTSGFSGSAGESGISGFSGSGRPTHIDTVDPTQNDDNTASFEIGDHWVNTVTDEAFILVDDSTGNAVWVSVSAGGSSGTSGFSGVLGSSGVSGFSGSGRPTHIDTVDPTQNDDNTAGFEIGDHWVNTVTDEVFILVDDSTGNAVWVSVTAGTGGSGTSGFSGIGTSGTSGFSGTGIPGGSGTSGFSGAGLPGESGISGFSGLGISGYSGQAGLQGVQGYSGTSGFSGTGSQGQSGISGYSGIGLAGASGISGYSGAGTSGYSGQAGSPGLAGNSGTSGYSGTAGASGVSGYSGLGISGASGAQGISGYSGSGASSAIDTYDNTGGLTIGASFTDIPLDKERQKDPGYEHSTSVNPAVITIKKAGRYRVIARVSLDHVTGGTDHTYLSSSECRVVVDSGSGYVDIDGGSGFGYHGDIVSGENTATVFALHSFLAGDRVKLQARQLSGIGVTTLKTIQDGSGILIEYADTTGTEGYSGNSGFSGVSGQGQSGMSGTSGFSGSLGGSGFSGISGFSGAPSKGRIEYQIETTRDSFLNGLSGFSATRHVDVGRLWAVAMGPFSKYAIDFSTELPTGIDDTDDMEVNVVYHVDSGVVGDMRLRLEWEVVDVNQDTTPTGPTGFQEVTLTTPGSVEIKQEFDFTVPVGDFSQSTESIRFTLIRNGNDVLDTFDGTLHVESLVVRLTAIGGGSLSPGSQGISGVSGFSGCSGQAGLIGLSGFSGQQGTIGIPGASGASGFSGQGQSGTSGFSAFSGFSGLSEAYPFGANPQFNKSDVESTTDSSSWQIKATMITSALTGTYWIEYCAEIGNDTTVGRTEIRLQNTTDNNTLCLSHIESKDTSNWYSVSGFDEVDFTGSPKTFEIQFRLESGLLSNAKVRRARIRILRKS